MAPPRNLLLFGATGTIGSYILDAILSTRDQFGRIAIFTSARTAETKASDLNELKTQKNVEVIVGNVEDENAVKAAYKGMHHSAAHFDQIKLTRLSGIDTVISALGRTALALQIPLIKLAAASSSVKWFLPSEYGTDIAYGPASVNEKPHQQKLKVRALLEKEISRADLEYTYVVTGPFADMYLHLLPGLEEAGGWDVKAKKAVLLGEKGEDKISLTTMTDPEIRNRALCVNSFTTSPAQIQAEFERQTGSKWNSISYTSLPRLRELEAKAWEDGKPAATAVTLRRIWTEGGTLYAQRDNVRIREPRMMGLEEVVRNEISRVLGSSL
ncbi:hypothetical protein N7510_001936 [Penicillium lagena]|uniref:uncharacterized protein n=1 Tax=Penicillium lagena TaxID=94218 RepID=UPI0025423915|nr:uncharacterized protein N7510_001936 [Penicillium lagena]KAJ5625627.1 hypothetical protein N7510_001936 [Penicillium lagena]